MKKLSKMIMSILLVAVMCMSLLPARAFALSKYTDTDLTITFSFIHGGESHKPSATLRIPASWGNGSNSCKVPHSGSVSGSVPNWTVTFKATCGSKSVSDTRSFTCADYQIGGYSASKNLSISFKNTYSSNTQSATYYTYTSGSSSEKIKETRRVKYAILHREGKGEWTVAKAAEVGVEGEETSICAHDASHVQTRPIEALPMPEPEPEPHPEEDIEPDPVSLDPAPNTGDDSFLAWSALSVSLLGLVVLALTKKRGKQE